MFRHRVGGSCVEGETAVTCHVAISRRPSGAKSGETKSSHAETIVSPKLLRDKDRAQCFYIRRRGICTDLTNSSFALVASTTDRPPLRPPALNRFMAVRTSSTLRRDLCIGDDSALLQSPFEQWKSVRQKWHHVFVLVAIATLAEARTV